MDFTAQLDYGDGRTAQFTSSFNTAFQTRAEIRGSLGRLELTRRLLARMIPKVKYCFLIGMGI